LAIGKFDQLSSNLSPTILGKKKYPRSRKIIAEVVKVKTWPMDPAE